LVVDSPLLFNKQEDLPQECVRVEIQQLLKSSPLQCNDFDPCVVQLMETDGSQVLYSRVLNDPNLLQQL
jgi:hypothetical protein